MITCSSGPTVAEDWRNGFCSSAAGRKRTARTNENINGVKELVFFSQEDTPAPETHRTVRHFGQKKWHYCESDFPILDTSVLIAVFNYRYVYFRNRVANVVEISNIYANQLIINVAKS